jgi:hypothetical protein
MDTFDIKGCIKSITSTIQLIMKEIEVNKEVMIIQKEKLPIYSTILLDIIKILSEFDKLENYKILSHHTLSFSIIKIINLDIFEINNDFKIISTFDTIPKKEKKCLFCMSKIIEENRPSYIKKKIEQNFDKINTHLNNLEALKNNIFGSAYRIKHPVLQKIWLLSGSNDLNNSTIDKDLFLDNTFNLYKIYCMKKKATDNKPKTIFDEIRMLNTDTNKTNKISEIVDNYHLDKEDNERLINNKIDLLFNKLNKNDKLSINELNNIDSYYYQFDNIKDFLYSFNQNYYEVNDNVVEINTNYKGPYELIGNNKIDDDCNKLVFEGYGSDFSNKPLFTFKLPERELFKDKEYKYIQCYVKAFDQGWGGTGHVHVMLRFESASKKTFSRYAFGINRNKQNIIDNIYPFKITQDEIDIYQLVTIYLVCPYWSGWKGRIEGFNAMLHF